MPFVHREKTGEIVGLSYHKQPGDAEEYLAEDHPDVAVFLATNNAPPEVEPTEIEVRLAIVEKHLAIEPTPAAIAAEKAAIMAARKPV